MDVDVVQDVTAVATPATDKATVFLHEKTVGGRTVLLLKCKRDDGSVFRIGTVQPSMASNHALHQERTGPL